jgi:hypothetical protein
MSKKQSCSLYKEARAMNDIEALASDASNKIPRRAKNKLLGKLKRKSFEW